MLVLADFPPCLKCDPMAALPEPRTISEFFEGRRLVTFTLCALLYPDSRQTPDAYLRWRNTGQSYLPKWAMLAGVRRASRSLDATYSSICTGRVIESAQNDCKVVSGAP